MCVGQVSPFKKPLSVDQAEVGVFKHIRLVKEHTLDPDKMSSDPLSFTGHTY